MSCSKILLALLISLAIIVLICYDVITNNNSVFRNFKIARLFSQEKTGHNSEKTLTKSIDYRVYELHRLINNMRAQYGILNTAAHGNSSLRGIPWTSVRENVSAKFQRRKVVLAYTALFYKKPWPWMKNTNEFNHWQGVKCPYYQCELTFNRRDRPRSDALLFHARDMPHIKTMRYIFENKALHQRWVYFAEENPMNNPYPMLLNLMFNWTLTYKRDSDIIFPYGYYFKMQNPVKISKEEYLKGKTRLVVWTSSHCKLRRDDYVQKLLKFIKVDVFGACGVEVGSDAGACAKDSSACELILKTYKFQLAFENTNCVDYITEKYWHALKMGIVPVVMGGANYDSSVAVPGSYINIIDFPSVKSLADYLMYLDNNNTAYEQYFSWKEKYMIADYAPWNCILCAKLYLDNSPKVYQRLDKFWSAEEHCGINDKVIYEMVHTTNTTK